MLNDCVVRVGAHALGSGLRKDVLGGSSFNNAGGSQGRVALRRLAALPCEPLALLKFEPPNNSLNHFCVKPHYERSGR